MTKDEKKLLIQDLSARLPYRVKFSGSFCGSEAYKMEFTDMFFCVLMGLNDDEWMKPYLRPFSALTAKEKRIIDDMTYSVGIAGRKRGVEMYVGAIDLLLKNHVDFRGLIPKGLAFEAPKDMYVIN